MDLIGKVALVTGGAQGLGRAIAENLLEQKCKVTIADINQNVGKKTAEELSSKYGADNVLFVVCDVTKEESFEVAFKKTVEKFSGIDIVVNNAGIAGEDKWRKIFDINLSGVFIGTNLGFKYMGKNNGGRGGFILNTASLVGIVKMKAIHTAYCASKFGVVGLTLNFGSDPVFERTGVKCSAICPDIIRTDLCPALFEPVKASPNAAEFMQKLEDNMLSPDFVAKGAIQVLKDDKNGALLKIRKECGYEYVEGNYDTY